MDALLVGAAKPRKYPLYNELKEDREIAKANLLTGELSLDSYMGKMGHLSAKHGKASLNSNYSETDFSENINVPGNEMLHVTVSYESSGNKRRRDPIVPGQSQEQSPTKRARRCPAGEVSETTSS